MNRLLNDEKFPFGEMKGKKIKDLEDDGTSEKLQEDCRECYWRLQSETSSLATVLLINQTSMDYFFKEYIPSIFYLGKEKAFENAFGFTMDEFYVTFEEFLNLPESEQLKILKPINLQAVSINFLNERCFLFISLFLAVEA